MQLVARRAAVLDRFLANTRVTGRPSCPYRGALPQVAKVNFSFLVWFTHDQKLRQDLSNYSKVFHIAKNVFQGLHGLFTGIRVVRMEISVCNHVPNFLRVNGHRVTPWTSLSLPVVQAVGIFQDPTHGGVLLMALRVWAFCCHLRGCVPPL